MLLPIGIEVSNIIIEKDDIYGHGVNLAARLMSLADPGEIVVSEKSRDQLTPGMRIPGPALITED